MRVLELDHVGLNVADVDLSVRFYRDVMGLEQLARPAFDFAGAWFALGSGQLHLIGKHASGDGRFKECHYSILVEDLDAFVAHLDRLGVERRGPKARPDGVRQLFLLDPDGHQIELCAPA